MTNPDSYGAELDALLADATDRVKLLRLDPDYWELSKEEWDRKYSGPRGLRWWYILRNMLRSRRFSWGIRIGSWVAGEDLGEMIFSD